jgi:Flp pilus assembly protein TadB
LLLWVAGKLENISLIILVGRIFPQAVQGLRNMANSDYYQILQVGPEATSSEIREAYYQLIQKRYAQRGKDIETAVHIQQVSEAYTILGNPYRRALYDLERLQGSSSTNASPTASSSSGLKPIMRSSAVRPRTQWYLMACILLLGVAAILSAVLQGLYWLPVLMIVALCVLMNLMAILLTRDSVHRDIPKAAEESSHRLQT